MSVRRLWLLPVMLFFPKILAFGQTAVLTQHNDNSRTGQNLNETVLTPSNVSSTTFGKLFSQPVDGQIYAQPLYVPNVAIQGKGTHNVIFVATEADSVYAYDADNNAGANISPLWKASLIDAAHGATAGASPVSNNDVGGCTDLQPIIGITATPVIDPAGGTMYVEAKSKENGGIVHRLHAIDIITGNEKASGPVVITATVPGSGDGSSGGQLAFNPQSQHSRPGLLLLNGTVYLAFASHCDLPPYHGWLFAYDASTLSRKAVFVTTPNGSAGGFWMSGAGFAADGNGNIYGATGNGTFDTTNVPATELGDSILKLSASNLSLLDYFTPFNQDTLNNSDMDVGAGGVLLLPDQPGNHPHELVQAGKEGRIYLVDRDQMTAGNQHFCSNCASDTQIVQESGSGQLGGMWSMPAYWNNNLYFWGSGDVLKSIPLSNGLLDFAHITTSTAPYGFPGATPSISANGTSNGIVWSIDSSQYGSPGPGPGPAVLHAHDATNVANELWNSSQAANNRDTAGNAVKFTVPTIANGKVYIGTSAEVDVYGLLGSQPSSTATPVIAPASESVTSSVQVTITDGTPGAVIYYTTDGSTPSAASPTHGTHYTSPFTVNSTTTVKAAAMATAAAQSGIASATYTIQPNAISSINYSSGMAAAGLILSGSASIVNSRLRLTDTGNYEAGSAFVTNPVNVQSFTTDFLFQLTTPNADGFTFTIHGGTTPGALGPNGGGLGYGPDTPTGAPGIPSSVAVKFDLYDNAGEGIDSTGLYTDGASPTIPSVDLTGSGMDLHSGDVFEVHISYDGTNLAMTITDTLTRNTFSHAWPVNIPSTVGGSTAYVGFTGATGRLTAIQEIIDWTYVSGPRQAGPPADFQIAISPGSGTASPGTPAMATVMITPQNGFSQQVSFKCDGLPSTATCAFSPASVTPNGTAVATTTLSISVSSAGFTGGTPWLPDRGRGRPYVLAMLAILVLVTLLRRKSQVLGTKRALRAMLAIGLAMTAAQFMAGCSSSSPQSSSNPPPVPQTFTISVTAASGSLSHSSSYTLTVK